eukprot:3352498-Amphidinium_carterae.1
MIRVCLVPDVRAKSMVSSHSKCIASVNLRVCAREQFETSIGRSCWRLQALHSCLHGPHLRVLDLHVLGSPCKGNWIVWVESAQLCEVNLERLIQHCVPHACFLYVAGSRELQQVPAQCPTVARATAHRGCHQICAMPFNRAFCVLGCYDEEDDALSKFVYIVAVLLLLFMLFTDIGERAF